MARHLVRLPREDRGLLEIVSHARTPTLRRDRLSPDQIAQVARTVRRTPEVMVKVTGGGTSHSRRLRPSRLHHPAQRPGTPFGRRHCRLGPRHAACADQALAPGLIQSPGWKPGRLGQARACRTSWSRTLSCRCRVLHRPKRYLPQPKSSPARSSGCSTDTLWHYIRIRRHPHVHLVVKSEGYDGRRLHIDEPMLRAWREDFARMMRAQGVAANATPRALRGRNQGHTRTEVLRARQRKSSTSERRRIRGIGKELHETGRIVSSRPRVARRDAQGAAAQWEQVARTLDTQGEIVARRRRSLLRENPPRRC